MIKKKSEALCDQTLKDLARFLVKAKKKTYAGDGGKIDPQRPGFKELVFTEGDWNYRDSYAGFYFAPGQEIVRYRGIPFWAMSYAGGMRLLHHGHEAFAKQTFAFLKKVLLHVEENRPFRGPAEFLAGDYKYLNGIQGDIVDFSGEECITHDGRMIFKQKYIGGLILE